MVVVAVVLLLLMVVVVVSNKGTDRKVELLWKVFGGASLPYSAYVEHQCSSTIFANLLSRYSQRVQRVCGKSSFLCWHEIDFMRNV